MDLAQDWSGKTILVAEDVAANYLLIAFINAVMIYYSAAWIRSAGYFESPVLRLPNWMVQVQFGAITPGTRVPFMTNSWE